MQIYGPSQVHGAQQISPPHASRAGGPAATSGSAPIQDEVSISDAAQIADASNQTAGIRQDRVDSIRAQIASGTYETPEKLDAALSNFLDQVG